MKIRVKFFATLAEVAQARHLDLEVAEDCTLEMVWNQLATQYPGLAPHANSVLRAVNEEFRRADTVVHEGDEVAFFPPVSGG